MTAKGKINASNVTTGDRIIVKVTEYGTSESRTKTGEGAQIARVIGKTFRAASGPYEARGKYVIETSAGSFEAAPIQTMWLAPEDNAGIKRARTEADAEDIARDAVKATAGWVERDHAEALILNGFENERRASFAALAAGSTRVENETAPAPPTTEDYTETLMDEAMREDWARGKVAAAGKSWDTHLMKFGGTVLARETAPVPPTTLDARSELAQSLVQADHEEAIEQDQRHQDEAVNAPAGECPECGGPLASDGVCADDECGGMDAGCEAKGCDLPEGALECLRCGAELVTEFDPEAGASAPVENQTGSTVVALLEKVWARIRADHPELPEVVIITGSGLTGTSKWGHFRAEGWKLREEGAAVRKHELFLAGEALAKGARQVLQTMLHEAAHTLAKVRDLSDTSRQGRWHNQTFRKLAAEMGLEHKSAQADKGHGYSFVTLTEATLTRYADLLAELDREIHMVINLPGWLGGAADGDEAEGGEQIGRGQKKPTGDGSGKSRGFKTTCGCAEPVAIRLSKKVLELAVVKCTGCDELFTTA